jgi:hypothetical protein
MHGTPRSSFPRGTLDEISLVEDILATYLGGIDIWPDKYGRFAFTYWQARVQILQTSTSKLRIAPQMRP